MERIFNARDVAIIGVSDRPGNLGRDILRNLMDWGYEGGVYGVNPKGGEALGFPLYKSVSDLPKAVDLAVLIIPAPAVPGVAEECGRKGITRLAIPAGGFEEFGEEGRRIRDELVSVASKYGIRFVGPNCFTVINAHTGLCLPFVPVSTDIPRGGVSIIAQSGGVGLSFLTMLRDENAGFSKFVSMGNKTDLDEVDYLEYMGSDPQTEVICMYLEDVGRGRELLEKARAANKPILAYKANVEPLTTQSARSHTAALANNDEVLDGAFRQAGIIRVRRLKQLAEYAKVFSLPPLSGNRVALVSPTGGMLVLSSDQCARRGFEFPPLSPPLVEDINDHLRAGVVNVSNPVDLGDVHDADSRVYIINRLLEQDYIDGVIAVFTAKLTSDGEVTTGGIYGTRKNILPELGEVMRRRGKPLFLCLVSASEVLAAARRGVDYPVFADPEGTVDAAAMLRDYSMRTRGQKPCVEGR